MTKQVLFGKEAKEKMLRGLDTAANAVGGTLGPRGLNAYISGEYESEITNDGATIASQIKLRDKFEDLGAEIVRNASGQTNDDAGDGTTTTAVLLQAIVHEAIKRAENPMELRDSLFAAGKKAVGMLHSHARGMKPDELRSIALVSAENEAIADMVTSIVRQLGKEAVITVDDSRTWESSAETTPGYDAPVGFLSPYFVNDKATGKAKFDDVPVLVAERKIANLIDLKPLFDQFDAQGIRKCVIVCDEIDEAVLGVLAVNNLKGVFNCVVIRAHGEILEDIEGAVGARAVADRHGLAFAKVKLEDLGRAEKVVADAQKTLFLGRSVSASQRAQELEARAQNDENQYRKQKLLERAAKLRGGVGVLKIGAYSDKERTYLKRKAEDAIKAVQAALEEGVVVGGGWPLFQVAEELGKDDSVGAQVLSKALARPLQRILENAGQDWTTVVTSEGWDVKQGIPCDMEQAGIIDPVKVERCALQNALSAAATFITAFVAIVDDDEPTVARNKNT